MSIIQLASMNETLIGREDDLGEPDFEDRRVLLASRLCIRAGRDSGSDSTCRATGAPGTAGGGAEGKMLPVRHVMSWKFSSSWILDSEFSRTLGRGSEVGGREW
jgi:hypothetical protein